MLQQTDTGKLLKKRKEMKKFLTDRHTDCEKIIPCVEKYVFEMWRNIFDFPVDLTGE